MVNPSKWANLKSNFLKFHHRNQVILGIEKARKMAYFRAFLALLSCRLSLAELRSATSGFEAVLLTFLHTRIAGQEASLLQDRTVLLVLLQQSAAQAVTDSASLTGNTAAGNADDDVVLALQAQQDQRRTDDQLQGLQTKVAVVGMLTKIYNIPSERITEASKGARVHR